MSVRIDALRQDGYTGVFFVVDADLPRVEALLERVGRRTNDAALVFGHLPTVRFARVVLVPRCSGGSCLVLATDFDGPLEAHLRSLGAPKEASLYSFCKRSRVVSWPPRFDGRACAQRRA